MMIVCLAFNLPAGDGRISGVSSPIIPSTAPITDQPPQRRRWIPLSLRLFVALLAILAAVSGWEFLCAYRQLEAIREIERAGGKVETSPAGPKWLRSAIGNEPMRMLDHTIKVSVPAGALSDTTLRAIAGWTNLQELKLKDTQLTDAGLNHLQRLTSLKSLDLSNTQVTDVGLAHLQRLTRLRVLDLSSTRLTDAGLAHFQGLTSLKSLSVGDTRVTDAGLNHLQRLTILEGLSVANTHVTDAGLAHLQPLTGLQWLSLRNTQVTDAGAAELRRALPRLLIFH